MVAILLSTYNGVVFLPGQLQSFLDQTHQNWVLFWRDDGSTDETVAIMEAFEAQNGRCVRIIDSAGRLGATGSFLSLLRSVSQSLSGYDIIAFSDQDDVWLPEKLARGAAALTTAQPDVPALYCARQTLVDAELRRVGNSQKVGEVPAFPMSLTQNIAAGCTMMLNWPAIALVADSAPPPTTFHDWWCYLMVAASGGTCLYDDAEVILYRQHCDNLVGASRSWRRRAQAAARRGPAPFMGLFREHLTALMSRPHLLSEKAIRDTVLLQRAFRSAVLCRLPVIYGLGLRRQTLSETLVLYLWFAMG